MTIPKIIHQTYKNHELPSIYEQCQSVIKRLHPDFDYRFYTDTDMYTFIRERYPEYYDKFMNLPRKIMQVDMVRYFLMYEYGGVYADMDYLFLNPFDLLGYNCILPVNREGDNGEPVCLGNCIFASEPRHPFWKTLMDSLFTIDRTLLDYKTDSVVCFDPQSTGPVFVYDSWKNYTDKDSIFTPRRYLFHPQTSNDETSIRQLQKNGAYGMHICTGVWMNNDQM